MNNRGLQVFNPATDRDQLANVTLISGAPTLFDTLGVIRKLTAKLSAFRVATVDSGGAAGAQGSQKLWTFPEGVIQIHGSVFNFTLQREGAGIAAGAAVVASLGSVTAGAGDATLATTEADLVASTVATLTAGVGSAKKHGSFVAIAFDGHTTPMSVFLNFAIPDADSSANDALLLTGFVTVFYLFLGDY
jgi:hypothetical protein